MTAALNVLLAQGIPLAPPLQTRVIALVVVEVFLITTAVLLYVRWVAAQGPAARRVVAAAQGGRILRPDARADGRVRARAVAQKKARRSRSRCLRSTALPPETSPGTRL